MHTFLVHLLTATCIVMLSAYFLNSKSGKRAANIVGNCHSRLHRSEDLVHCCCMPEMWLRTSHQTCTEESKSDSIGLIVFIRTY